MSPDSSKGAHYTQLLDEARCQSNWAAVPELVRKVRKHAPNRSCLALVAETEYAVLHSHQGQYDGTGKIDKGRLASLSRPLSEALDKETAFAEDDFQAQSCLAWIYWLMGDAESACSTLRNNVEQEFARLDGTRKDTAPWTKICAIRACYIKGAALLKRGDTAEAFEVLESSLPILASITSKPLDGSPEQRTWTELLLTQLCILSARAIKARASPSLESEALAAFRAWFSFWERQKGQVMSHGGHLNSSNTPRRLVWKEYFTVLSIILQEGLPYPTTTMATTYNDASTRLLQRSELQRVEAKYEELLLEEVQFPQAEQSADEVEEWAENVIQNWRIVCGSEWQEQDTTRSGSEQASRRVLDILYRAATKTFHSTAVMRHLFTVHLTLGELQLAFKAFDTYLEMVKKGKARFEKTGEVEKGFDDDETILKAISQCIRALCRYSCSDGATKAKDLGHFLEGWLQKAETTNGTSSRGDNGTEIPFQSALSKPVSNSIRAAAWRAVGIAQAQWARYTIEATTRSDIQSRAIKNLQTALLPGTQDVETCFALGTILAEHRQLDAAINVVKRALSHQSSSSTTAVELGPHGGRYARERAMLPLWHLLALLLSAKQEFPTAVRACEGAFEQFKDPKILFGDSETDIAYRSEHLNVKALNEKGASQSWGLVDIMDDIEKETILEVKMTQLALIETQEGPLAAVNASDELLSLFTRLFGEPHKSINQPPKTTQSVVPHSSAGTLRSIKGSIFGRSRRSVTRRSDSVRDQPSISEKSDLHHRPYTTQTQNNALKRTPTIQVTSDSDQGPVPTHHHEKLQKYSASLSRQKSAGSARSRSVSAGPPNGTYSEKALPQRSASQRSRTGTAQRNISTPINTAFVPTSSPESPTRSTPAQLPPIPQNLVQNERELKPAASALQDTRLPYVSPVHMTSTPPTRFPQDQERRGRIGLLIKVWLLIASFYRRAELYEDAKGAIGEAYKLVDGLELDVSRDPNASIYHSWNHYKSVEELWADVWSERGYLSKAKGVSYTALAEFESALNHYPDHPSATVGLSEILLDIYTEQLLPSSTAPTLNPPAPLVSPSQSDASLSSSSQPFQGAGSAVRADAFAVSPGFLGLPTANLKEAATKPNLPSSHRELSTAMLDRLAARDRAYGLLSGLTKLGTGWNYSEAWFALARVYEESGQVDKARDALWWCVELEENRAVRDWRCAAAGGYVL